MENGLKVRREVEKIKKMEVVGGEIEVKNTVSTSNVQEKSNSTISCSDSATFHAFLLLKFY